MVWAFKQQAIVTLRFAVVCGEDDIGIIIPGAILEPVDHAPASVVDQLVLDMRHGIDFTYLVRRHSTGNKVPG